MSIERDPFVFVMDMAPPFRPGLAAVLPALAAGLPPTRVPLGTALPPRSIGSGPVR
jgi:hypothetical protein